MPSGRNALLRLSETFVVTIANGEALSSVVDKGQFALGGLIMPAAWTAADIGFHVCNTATGTFVPLYDRENALSIDVMIDGPAANRAYPLPPYLFGWRYFKVWSQNAGSDENQGGARTITLTLVS